jgi:hypothetical protein
LWRSASWSSTTHQAQPNTISQCPANRLCLWRDINFSGTVWHFGDDPRDNTWVFVGGAVNDQASSLFNNRNLGVAIGKDYDATQVPASGPNGTAFRRLTSSWTWRSSDGQTIPV